MTWGALFERAEAFGVTETAVREALARRRERHPEPEEDGPAHDAGDGP